MPKLTRFDELVTQYGHFVVRWRWPVMLLMIVLSVLAATGVRFLEFKTDYRVWFSDQNPQLLAFEELQGIYTKNDNILFVLEPEGGDVFAPEVLNIVEELTAAAWRLPYAMRVDSITNFQHTEAEEDDLIVEDLVSGAAQMSPAEIEHVRQIALAEPLLVNRLVAADQSVTAVNVTFQMPEQALDEVPQTAAAARTLAAQLEADHPGIGTYLTGIVMLNNAFPEAAQSDFKSLTIYMYIVIILALLFLVRSLTGTVGTVLLIMLAASAAFGLAGFAGVKLTPPSISALTMIMTLAVADAVHLLMSMKSQMRHGMEKIPALIEALRINFGPIFLTSFTTAIGFLSMNFSDAPPFRDLGNITATGVMIAFVLSVTFLAAFAAIFPVRPSKATHHYARWMDKLADFVVARHTVLLATLAVLFLGIVALIPRNELNDEFVKYFDESISFRTDTDFTVERLTGIYQVQYSLDTQNSNGVSDPEFLVLAEEFTGWLHAQPEVKHVSTITDTFKRLNKSMHADDQAWYRLPEARDLAAQYLLLYELSLPFGLDLNNQLTIDKAATQIVVTLDDITSRELREFAERGDAWIAEHATGVTGTSAGTSIMFANISKRNIEGMIRGTTLTMLIISGLLIIALRSVTLGVLSLIPNILPAALAFGLWGLFVGQVNMAISVVAAMSLGIIVDDTVHFLSKYLRARRERGFDAPAAVRYAFSTVGMALVITTAVLVAGFSVLAQSDFAVNNGMAKLTAITILLALFVDFLLLPPILIKLDAGKTQIRQIPTESSDDKRAFATSV